MRGEALGKAYTLRQGVSAGEISAQEALEEIERFLEDPSLFDSDRKMLIEYWRNLDDEARNAYKLDGA